VVPTSTKKKTRERGPPREVWLDNRPKKVTGRGQKEKGHSESGVAGGRGKMASPCFQKTELKPRSEVKKGHGGKEPEG